MHRTKIGGAALALAALAALAACSGGKADYGVNCPDIYAYGVVVSVRDSTSGADAVAGATGVAIDGTFRDSVSVPSGKSPQASAISLAGERAGTYTVIVRKAGYKDWTNSNVVVTRDACHVRTVTLTAQLQPGP